MLSRYNCFVLDEFATGPPSKNCTQRLPPHVEEIASVLSCLVRDERWRHARLVVTSAALDQDHVRATMQETNIGFLPVETRRFDLHRFVAAPRNLEQILQVCSERVIQVMEKIWKHNRFSSWHPRNLGGRQTGKEISFCTATTRMPS